MAGYLSRRFAASLLLVFLVVSLTFFLVHLAPGDPFGQLLVEGRSDPAQYAQLRRLYGLDRPLPEQYLVWLGAVLRGDWGVSISQQRPVVEMLGEALPLTALLAFAALSVEWVVSLLFGVWAARRRDQVVDHAVRIGSLAINALPTFWLATMALLLFAHLVPVFPPSSTHSPGADSWSWAARTGDLLYHLALPALVLGLASAGATTRFVRNSLLEIVGQDYVRTARAKGLSEARVLFGHALPNALTPLLQLLGLSLPMLLNGSLVIESIFAWPGVGRVAFQAIVARDYPVLLAATALTGVLVVAGNLIADLLQAAVDPRVRRG